MFAIPLYYCTDVTGPSILQPALYYKVVPQDKGENIKHHHKDMKDNNTNQINLWTIVSLINKVNIYLVG